MPFRNKELIDRGFTNVKTKVRTLDTMVARGGANVQDFRNSLKALYDKIEELEEFVEREHTLKNG